MINLKDLPLNFKAFMEFFSSNLFDMIPNFLEVDEDLEKYDKDSKASRALRRVTQQSSQESDYSALAEDKNNRTNRYCNLNEKLKEQDQRCLILNKSGNRFFILLVFLVLKVASCALAKLLRRRSSKSPANFTPEDKSMTTSQVQLRPENL